MRVTLKLLTLVLALSLGLAACKTAVSRKEAINQSLIGYEQALRWESPRNAYKFLVPELQPNHTPSWLDQIRIVGYETIDSPTEVEKNKVVQTVKIQYVNQATQIMQTMEDRQVWTTRDDGKTWLRANPVPNFPN